MLRTSKVKWKINNWIPFLFYQKNDKFITDHFMILRISVSSVNIMHFKSERVDKCNMSASDKKICICISQLRKNIEENTTSCKMWNQYSTCFLNKINKFSPYQQDYIMLISRFCTLPTIFVKNQNYHTFKINTILFVLYRISISF